MNAIDLLKKQHLEVADLFAQFEITSKKPEKRAIFEKIAASLVAHDTIEREILYPACKRQMGNTDMLGEAIVEHGLIEFMLFRADQNLRKDALDTHVMVLREVVRHHVTEEEDEFFPKVMRELGKNRLEELGLRMGLRYREALLEGDWRTPLRATLAQVLEGATETKKPKKKAAAPKPRITKARNPARELHA